MTTPGTPGDSNLDNIIKKNFPTEIQQRRVKLELKYLKELDQNCYKVSLQSSPLGLKIIVSLTKDFILGQIPDSKKFQHPIMFEFLLEPKFPFVFPKLLCKTNITHPSLADGRDFVFDVIQRMWNPSIMLRDVVTFIPEFLKKINELAVPEETQTMGSYYLGHLYNLEDFLSMDSVQVFNAKEKINEQSTNNDRFLVLSESYFLNFESVDKVRNTLRLIGWAHVHSIFKIKRDKDDHKMIVVLWRDSNNKGILIQNVFIMDESTQFIEAFIRASDKYADISDAIRKKRDLPLSEVTAKSYQNMDIEQLLETIEILESKLEVELDIDTINLLMNLYQKAVEYFSALNDETYSIFMEKLHVLLTREDIQVVIKSGESMPVPQKSKPKAQKPQDNQQKSEDNIQKQEPVVVQPVAQVIQEAQKEEAPQPVEQKVEEVIEPQHVEEKPKEEEAAQPEPEKKEEPVQEPEPVPVQKEEEKPQEPEVQETKPEEVQNAPEQKEEEEVSVPEVSQPESQEPQKAEEPEIEEPKTEENKPEEPQIEEPKAEEVKPEEPQAEEQKPEETKPEDIKPEEPQVEEQKTEEAQPEEVKVEETKPEEPQVEEQKPEETQPEEVKPEETQPEEPQAEETKPEEEKPEEPKTEEKKEEEGTTHMNVAIANDDMFDIGDDDDD